MNIEAENQPKSVYKNSVVEIGLWGECIAPANQVWGDWIAPTAQVRGDISNLYGDRISGSDWK